MANKGRVFRSGASGEIARLKGGRFTKSPCGLPPATPTGFAGHFDRSEGGRHHRIRVRAHWNDVTADTIGFPIWIRHYVLELWNTPNGDDWFLSGRENVAPQKDGDDPTDAHHIFKRPLNPRLAYKLVLYAVGRDDCKSNSVTDVLGSPGAEGPAAPENVEIHGHTTARAIVVWDAPKMGTDGDDDGVLDDRIEYFQVVLMQNTTDAPDNLGDAYHVERFAHKTKHTFHIAQPDIKGNDYYAWVRSVGEHGKSVWVPGLTDPNSDPDATPDPFDTGQPDYARVMRFSTNDMSVHTGPDFNPHRGGVAYAVQCELRGSAPTSTAEVLLTLDGTDYTMHLHKRRTHSKRVRMSGHDGIAYDGNSSTFKVKINDNGGMDGTLIVYVYVNVDDGD